MTAFASIPADEPRRLAHLRALAVLDSGAEPVFDSLTRVASSVCGVPIALISLVDESRQWFKANFGLEDVAQSPREHAFCAHAILQDDILEVPDAAVDARFTSNPLVTGKHGIRFYAGAPLIMSDGERIGTLCVMDRRAQALSPHQRAILQDLALATVQTLEQREDAHYLALTASESKFQALSDFSPLGIFHTNTEGLCTYANTRHQEIYGLSLGESLGRGWSESLHPDDRDKVFAQWQHGVAAGAEFDMEFRVIRSGDTVVDVRAQARPVRTADGTISGYVGVVEDISGRQSDLDQLRASKAFLDQAERIAGVGAWELDLGAGRLRWTDQACRIYEVEPGYQPAIDEHLKHFDAQTQDLIERTFHDSALTGKPWNLQLPMVTAKGRRVWIRSAGQVVETSGGKAVRFVGGLQDVTDRKAMEDQLRRTNTLLETVLERLPCGVSAFDGELRLLAHNRQFRDMLGLPDRLFAAGEEPTFETLIRFNAERGEYGEGDVEQKIAGIVERARAPSRREIERTRPNGVALDIRAAPMPGGGFVNTYTDMSERRRSEAELRTSEERQQRALEASGLALWDFDLDHDVIYLSPAWSEMLGSGSAPTVTNFHALAALVPQEDWATVRSVMTPLLKGQVPVFSVEHRVRRADGSLIWIQSEARVAQRDAQGRASRVVGTNKDVTERRHVQDELKQTSCLLKAVLDAATGVGIICADAAGVISVFNKGAERLLGYSSEELVGHHTAALFLDPQELEAKTRAMSLALGRPVRDGEVWTHKSVRGREHEWTAVRKDGSRFKAALSLTPMRSVNAELLGYLATCHDVTQQRAYELSLREARAAAEQAAQAKAAFLATMSHEIRTPMNGVIGMTSLLLETALTDDQREFTEVIRQSGEVLLVVINDILDYSKIESGRMELEWLPFDLHEGVEGSIELLANKAREKQLDLMYLIEPEVPDWIHGDLPRLRQVLVNLISNALKFADRGEVFVSVRVPRTEPPAGDVDTKRPLTLEFCVRDTGIGIAADKMSRLFQPFSQVDSGTSRKYGGTGLGLAISKRLVEAMGGTLWVESEEGVGTRFHFTVRTAAADAVIQPGKLGLTELRGRNALLVDDNPTNLRILGLQAERWGMKYRTCPSAPEAVALVKGGSRFDVVVTDMHMPVIDGVALARELRAFQPSLPIVLLSSVKMQRSDAAGLFSAVLMKPAREVALFEALVRALPRAAPPARAAAPRVSQFDVELGKRLPLRILLAEDNEVNQKVALHVLKGFGYQADVAGNGLEVIDALKRQHYDLVLMDVQMPEMDGLEATRSILRNWPATARPRIVAMSANAMRDDTDAALAAGMDDYIVKPISVLTLRAVLETCGESRSMREAGAT